MQKGCATTGNARPCFFAVWLATLLYTGSVFYHPTGSVVTSRCSCGAHDSGRNYATVWTKEEKRSNPDKASLSVSLLQNVPFASGAHPAKSSTVPVGGAVCLRAKRLLRETEHSQVPRLGMCGVILPLPPICRHGVHRASVT
jgi:hypothetical protein